MARGDKVAAGIRSLWGAIQQSVNRRESTAETWQRVRSTMGLPDEGPTGIARAEFNRLRHDAAMGRNATEALGRSLERSTARNMDVAVEARHIAQAPWSRPLEEQNNTPMFQVNFEMTMVDENGNEDSGWFTTMFRGAIPATVQALADQVARDAEQMAGGYGKSLVTTGAIQMLAV